MIHAHSLGRAARYFSERPAIPSGARRLNFGEFQCRVARVEFSDLELAVFFIECQAPAPEPLHRYGS